MYKENTKLLQSSKIYLDELVKSMIYPLPFFTNNFSIDVFIDLYDNGGLSTICTKRD